MRGEGPLQLYEGSITMEILINVSRKVNGSNSFRRAKILLSKSFKNFIRCCELNFVRKYFKKSVHVIVF